MVKKTASAILIFLIMLMLCPVTFAKSYLDVPYGTRVYDAVDYLSEMGVISGYEDGLFKPDGEITRGEAAALIARSIGYTEEYVVMSLPFEDVKAGYWAERFISYCYEGGLINGMTATTYCPAEKVTYAQIVKMLVCASGLEGNVKAVDGGKWYDGYINEAEEKGILENVVISPNSPAPRSDVAILVYNCFDEGLMGDEEEEVPEIDEDKPLDDDDDVEDADDDIDDKEEAPTPTPVPEEPYKANKEDVTMTVEADEDYEFAYGMDYTPEVTDEDMDFSQLEMISEEEKLLVVIDAGHNFSGTDVGAHNKTYDLWEQNITWPVAYMLSQKLEMMGFEVVMTRDSYNTNIKGSSVKESLLNRAGIANELEADIFISIHCNAGGGKGVETYCYKKGTKAEKLAEYVQENLAEDTGLIDRGVKTAGFVVIKETVMPAILVETAFIDTEGDFNFIASKTGQDKLSTAIAKGVFEYAKSMAQ